MAQGRSATTLPSFVTPLRRLAALALVAVAATACSSSSGVAASVDGRTISHDDVVAELEAIRANEPYVASIEGTGESVLGTSEDAFNAAFVATQLGVRIQYALVGNEVDRRDLDADDACRQAATDSVVQNLAALSPAGDGRAVFEGFGSDYRDYLVERETDVLLLQGDLVGQPCLAEEAVESYFAEHRSDFEQACGAHILVETRAEADELVGLLRGGADFAALATERSIDAGSGQRGGDLGCLTRGATVPEFDAAAFAQPIGEIGDPVQSEFGFHVIRIDARQAPPLEAVRNDVIQALIAEVRGAFGAWYTDALAGADVEVDERYGRWDAASSQVVRPGSADAIDAGGDPTATSAPPSNG